MTFAIVREAVKSIIVATSHKVLSQVAIGTRNCSKAALRAKTRPVNHTLEISARVSVSNFNDLADLSAPRRADL